MVSSGAIKLEEAVFGFTAAGVFDDPGVQPAQSAFAGRHALCVFEK